MRQRSPAHPHVNLEQAVEKAVAIYEKTKGHPVAVEVAQDSMGVAPKSGTAKRYIGSLRQYGLLKTEVDDGNRTVRLSERALRIVRDQPGSPERVKATHAAALEPSIFQTIFARYGENIPAIPVMESHLKFEEGYNDDAAALVAKKFIETLEYASRAGDFPLHDAPPPVIEAKVVDVEHEPVEEEVSMASDGAMKEERGQFQFAEPLEGGGRAAFTLIGQPSESEARTILRKILVGLEIHPGDLPRLGGPEADHS